MTILEPGKAYGEWTLLLDAVNNEILAHSVTAQTGSSKPCYRGFEALKKRMGKREGQASRAVLHRREICLLFKGFLSGPP